MTYEEFRRHLGKAGLSSVREFANLVQLNPNSVTNYSKLDQVPFDSAIIAVLMGEMAEHGLDFRKILLHFNAASQRPKGKGSAGFGRDKKARPL